jgi:DNA-binding XRE family transcriptional regulator
MNFTLKFKILQKFPCQADFAKVVGLSESGLSRIVRGRKEPETILQNLIAKKLGCEPREIFPAKF